MTGNESDSLRYAMKHTFGIVHAVLLTLFSFGVSSWSFPLLGYFLFPLVSLVLTMICSASVQYVCDGEVHIPSILQKAWIPPLGVFCISLFILPLEMMKSVRIGPFSTLIATSIVMNAIVVWILQVYSSPDSESTSLPSPPDVIIDSAGGLPT